MHAKALPVDIEALKMTSKELLLHPITIQERELYAKHAAIKNRLLNTNPYKTTKTLA